MARFTKDIPHTVNITTTLRRCDMCGAEQSLPTEPEWFEMRGPFDSSVGDNRWVYDVCSIRCAQEVLKRLAVDLLVESVP